MPSPFPGMDPYLEDPAFWPDFHSVFITCWREAIVDTLPSHYEARIGERMSIIDLTESSELRFEPDIALTKHPRQSWEPADAATATLEPVTVRNVVEEETRESFIEIYRRPERRLVAVLELLSPSNKQGSGRTQYLGKRRAIMAQDVHLWELDLQIAGPRLPMETALPPADYYALVSRAGAWPNCDVYGWTLADRLPRLPIPLLPPDADIFVDLAAVFATTYERGRYARSLDYSKPPALVAPGELLKQIVTFAAKK